MVGPRGVSLSWTGNVIYSSSSATPIECFRLLPSFSPGIDESNVYGDPLHIFSAFQPPSKMSYQLKDANTHFNHGFPDFFRAYRNSGIFFLSRLEEFNLISLNRSEGFQLDALDAFFILKIRRYRKKFLFLFFRRFIARSLAR